MQAVLLIFNSMDLLSYINVWYNSKTIPYLKFTYHHIHGVQIHYTVKSCNAACQVGAEVLTGCDILNHYKICKSINELINHLNKVLING